MTSASVLTSSAVVPVHCPLPATFETAVAAVRQALPEERWDNVLLSCGVDRVEPGKALDNSTYALVSYDSLGHSAVSIAKTEHRGITVQQLLQIEKFIREHAHFWVEAFPKSPSFGVPLEAEKFNLHHACHWIISPATRKLCCSLVELMAMDADAQYPWWFVSHAWQEAVLKFVACLRQHAALRNVLDGAYWVCAYANNQHKLKEEICPNPRSTSFYRAMQLSIGVVLILDEKATPFSRIWCCFEESIAVEERNAGMPLLLDVAATDSANQAHVLTDGLTAAEECQMPLLGFFAKAVREVAFPTPLVQKGLEVDIAQANASQAADKTAILNSIRLPRARTKVLSDSAPLEDPNYTAVNQALAAHFALASWFGFVAKPHLFDSKLSGRLLSALAEDSFRRVVQLSFTGCRGFTDAQLNQLLRHLPRQLLMLRLDMGFSGVQSWVFPEVEEMEMPPLQELSLRFTGSHLANASGLGQMLGAEPLSQSLRSVQLWFSNLPSLVELGSWEFLTKLKLEEFVLQLNSCAVTDEAKQSLYECVQRLKRRQRGLDLRLKIEGVAERSWPWVPCQRPAVKDLELAGGKRVDRLENFGSETLPFPCSYGGCDVFHSNLSGFCPKHRMWQHGWKLARLWQTAWCWTQLSLLVTIQAAAEIQHRTTLVATLLSLYPVFCLSLEESVGVPWAMTCALLLVAVICSLVTTSVRFDNMRVQILKLSVATEASYSQVLQLPDGNMLRVPTMAGSNYPDSSVLHQHSRDLSTIYRDAQSRLPLFLRAMNLVLPNATVKIKLLTHLSNEEQQSPEKVLDALRCELVCEDMLAVQEAFKGLEDRIQSEDLASLHIAAVRETFAEMSGHKCCQVILQMENHFASVFLMDAVLTRMDNELSSVTKLAAQFWLLDDMKSKWETSLRLWNSVPDVRRPLVLAGTIFLEVVALAMSMFMALQYFLRYAHRIRQELPDLVLDGLLLDRGEKSGKTILEAVCLALPYLVLVVIFLQQLLCGKQSRKRPQPTKILYDRYFGLRGAYYPVKVAILQGLTVMVQAFGKISLMGGLVTFAQEEQDTTAIFWLSVGFWAFFALLCCNSVYPAILLMFPDTAWARIGAAFTDAALDLGYILTYLGTVLVAMLRLQTASEGWENFGDDLTLQFSNRINPVFAFPTDLLGYCAVYVNLAHACCIAHVLKHTNWSLPVRPRGERRKRRCLPRLFGCSLSIGLLSMLTILLMTQEVFPMTHGRDFKCFPCSCSKNLGSFGHRISSCTLAGVLRQTQVNLAAKTITAVDPKAFSKLGHVQRLSLANNSLIHLPPGLFEGLSSLEQLDLTRVKLRTLHEDSFRGLEQLKLLTMSENELTELSAATLRHLPLLEQLLLGGKSHKTSEITLPIVRGNRITELGAIFGHNEQLQVIDISQNRLRKIDRATFAGLKKLRWLSLQSNQLTTLPAETFQGLGELQKLNLYNKLTTFSARAFQGLGELRELNLKYNKLTTLPVGAFQGLERLQNLDLESNKLTTLPAGAFQGLEHLQILSLGGNQFMTLPTGTFQGLERLQNLDLGWNRLTLPAGAFQGLEQLQKLSLSSNKLTTLPTGTFQGLERLQNLDLINNKLTTLPAGTFQGLGDLQELNLRKNKLMTFSVGTFQGLGELRKLSLYSNKLTTLPTGTFQGLERLQNLDLESNKLTTLPSGAFQGLGDLQELNLRKNKLTTLPAGAFQGLERLQKLSLYSNKLTTLPAGAFRGLGELRELNLESNKLTTLSAGAFQGLEQLQKLSLYSNKLTTLPAGAFQGLERLQNLVLIKNKLTTLPAGAFQGLGELPELNLMYNKLTTLPAGAFQGLEQLQKLSLYSNELTTLPAGAFQGLERLQNLDLDSNYLSTLPAGAFQGLEKLQNLDLDSNKLTTLPAGAFQGLGELQILSLSSNQFMTLPAGAFQGLGELRELKLYNNKLTTLPAGAFQGLGGLRELNLYNNKLTTLPTEAFQGLEQLRKLSLDSNQFMTLPAGAFQGLGELQELSLSYIQLTTLPAGAFQGLGELQELNLKYNKLMAFSAGTFQGLEQLQKLSLYSNKLTTLPTGTFQGLERLQNLDLESNKLTTLPAGAFQGLGDLQELNLRKNKLTTLPAGAFQGLERLQKLSLYSNKLTTLPAGAFQGLERLQNLDLGWNKLTLSAGAFQGLEHLQILSLGGNQFMTLPAGAFQVLEQLQKLSLYSNKLTTLPAGAFQGLERLQNLDLRYNQFMTLPAGAFQGLEQLRELNLGFNQLTRLPTGAFQGLEHLQILSLDLNQLTTISAETFQGLGGLQQLHLRRNPWNSSTVCINSSLLPLLNDLLGLNFCKNVKGRSA